MFHQIRLRLFRKVLRNKLASLRVNRNPGNYHTAKSIGFLFDASQPGVFDLIEKYVDQLKREDKRVEMLGYLPDNTRHNELKFRHFNKKDINWYHVPKSALVQQFVHTQFDILYCMFSAEILPLEYCAALSQAHLRVGQYGEDYTHCFDLMIDVNQNKDPNYLLSQMDHFLKIINPKKAQYV